MLADEHPQAVIIEIETMKKLINADSNGISRTIVAQYGAKGYSCLLRNDGFGMTGVMEEVEPKMMQLVGDRGNPSVSVKETAFTVCSSPMSDRGQVVLEPKIAASRGRGKGWQQQLEINESGTSYAITSVQKDNYVMEQNLRMDKGCLVDSEGRKYRIRKLTPTECFRLQDVSDEDIEKIRSYRDDETAIICDANGEPIMNMDFDKPSKNARKITIMVNGEQREYYSSQLIWQNKGKGISKTAQYKLAGNSICVAPMYHIFRKLFIEKECENQQLELF